MWRLIDRFQLKSGSSDAVDRSHFIIGFSATSRAYGWPACAQQPPLMLVCVSFVVGSETVLCIVCRPSGRWSYEKSSLKLLLKENGACEKYCAVSSANRSVRNFRLFWCFVKRLWSIIPFTFKSFCKGNFLRFMFDVILGNFQWFIALNCSR